MDRRCSETGPDDRHKLGCSVCTKQNRTIGAEKLCSECQEYYCTPCSDMHNMFAMFEGHTLLTMADFSGSAEQRSVPQFPTERCQRHAFRVLEMYCETHDVTICPLCILDHRSCTNIRSIPNELDTMYMQSLFEETIKKLEASARLVEDVKAAKQVKLTELKMLKDQSVQAVKSFKNKIALVLDNLEKMTIDKIESHIKALETEIALQVTEAEQLIGKLRTISDKLQSSDGNKAQDFVKIKSLKKDVYALEGEVTRLQGVDDKTIDFEANIKIREFFESVKSLGSIVVKGQETELSLGSMAFKGRTIKSSKKKRLRRRDGAEQV